MIYLLGGVLLFFLVIRALQAFAEANPASLAIVIRRGGGGLSRASLMTTALKGKKEEEALALFGHVHTLLTVGPNGEVKPEDVGKLAVLSGVWEFPTRVKCATLAWHTLRSALEGKDERDLTE